MKSRRPAQHFLRLDYQRQPISIEYADQSREADRLVNEGIGEYLRQPRLPHEIEVGRRLQLDWSGYLGVRNEVLARFLRAAPKKRSTWILRGGLYRPSNVSAKTCRKSSGSTMQASQQLPTVRVPPSRTIFRLIGVLGINLGVGQRFRLRPSREQNARRDPTAKLQMGFVASVSHELRTPWRFISPPRADNIADVLSAEGSAGRVMLRNPKPMSQITEL